MEHHELLKNLGKGQLTENTLKDCELFICKMYNVQNVTTADQARSSLFIRSRAPEMLPPTSDALHLHIKRSHYQASLWMQAHCKYPSLPSPETMGWKNDDGTLMPQLMLLDPVPKSCVEMISCACTTACKSLCCKCRRSELPCTAICRCRDVEDRCLNNFT